MEFLAGVNKFWSLCVLKATERQVGISSVNWIELRIKAESEYLKTLDNQWITARKEFRTAAVSYG